jgi:hypothetical protein
MRILIEIFIALGLGWLFRTVRASRIASETAHAKKRAGLRASARSAEAWIKNATRDTCIKQRPRYIHDAPSYTTYTANKGKPKA